MVVSAEYGRGGSTVRLRRTESALTAALASLCSTIFLLASTLVNVEGMVQRIRRAGKLAVVHIDLVDGLSGREMLRFFLPTLELKK